MTYFDMDSDERIRMLVNAMQEDRDAYKKFGISKLSPNFQFLQDTATYTHPEEPGKKSVRITFPHKEIEIAYEHFLYAKKNELDMNLVMPHVKIVQTDVKDVLLSDAEFWALKTILINCISHEQNRHIHGGG